MLLALHCCRVAGAHDNGHNKCALRTLYQKWPDMMIEIMDLFMGVRAVLKQ